MGIETLSDFCTMLDSACFTCKEKSSSSFLASSYFEKLISSELSSEESVEIRLFGKLYPASSCVWVNLKELFSEVKRNFVILKGLSTDNMSSLKNDFLFVSAESLRLDVLRVLKFFLVKVQEMTLERSSSGSHSNFDPLSTNTSFNNVLMSLLREIKNLLMFVGPISKISGISNIRDFSSDHSKAALNFYHYYHLCLDIWFICLATAYKICLVLPQHIEFTEVFCESFDQSSPFSQLSSFIIFELTSLGLTRYQNFLANKSSFFPCPCIQDFWIMLIHLVEKNEVPFWSIYESILQMILKCSSSSLGNELCMRTLSLSYSQLPKESLLEALFWVTSHVAPLCKIYVGQDCSSVQIKSGYEVIKYLIHNILLPGSEAPEKRVRTVLSYCIPLVNLWEVRGEVLLPFTDFFIRKIEDSFCLQSSELTGLSCLFKNPSAWLAYISNLSGSNLTGKASSFDHFLQILCTQIKRDTDGSLWRVLKGRIYSKYTTRKIKEISEIGLQNTFSLFLAVAASGQFEISAKICEVASVVENTAHHRKQLIAWKAMFVLYNLQQEHKQISQSIITLMSNSFNSASMNYSKISQDSMHKNNVMTLLLIYIDNMKEIFRKNNFSDLSSHQLITKGFCTLLPSCDISEMNYILRIFSDILQNVLKSTECDDMSYEMHHRKIIDAIFDHVYPFIQNIAATDTPPSVVADIAIALTKIVFIFPSGFSCLKHDLHMIFKHFGCNENVNCSITVQYLSSIMDCPDLMNEIRLKTEDLDRILLQSWLKCSIYMHQRSEHMNSFTEKLLRADRKVIPELVLFLPAISDHVQASICFYQQIGETYEKSYPQKKAQIALSVQQVFKNFASYATNKIKKAKESDCFSHVYKLISHLIFNCSTVLHHHLNSNHILLEILDKTIYPQLLFPKDKVLQSLVSSSVKDNLPNILRGLFKLEYRKDKPIEREIRNITLYYISAFSPSNNNPLIKLMLDSVAKKPDGLTLDAYQFVLETLKSSFLSNNTEKPLSILDFYQELFKLTPADHKKEITHVLLKCCLEVFMKKNDAFSETLRIVLKKTLLYFRDKVQYSSTKAILVPVVQWFVMEKLQWSVMRGFSVLDIFVEYLPHMISDMMSFLTTSVETLEKNRGIGEDILLRNGLRNIVFKLQQKLRKDIES